jgi:hypothetical protein
VSVRGKVNVPVWQAGAVAAWAPSVEGTFQPLQRQCFASKYFHLVMSLRVMERLRDSAITRLLLVEATWVAVMNRCPQDYPWQEQVLLDERSLQIVQMATPAITIATREQTMEWLTEGMCRDSHLQQLDPTLETTLLKTKKCCDNCFQDGFSF